MKTHIFLVYLVLFILLIIGIYLFNFLYENKFCINVPEDFELEIEIKRDHPPLILLQIGEELYKFLIDTGSSCSAVGYHITKNFKNHWKGFVLASNLYSRISLHNYISIKEKIKLGSLLIPDNYRWLVIDKKTSDYLSRDGIDGIIGMDILSNFALILDYQQEQGFLLNSLISLEMKKRLNLLDSTDITMKNRSPQITLRIGKERYFFLIDTGASFSALLYKKIPHIEWEKQTIFYKSELTTLNQEEENDFFRIAKINNIMIGNKRIENLIARINYKISFSNIIGSLGINFLQEGIFLFDFINKRLYFHIPDNYCFYADATGLLKCTFFSNSEENDKSIGFLLIKEIDSENPLFSKYKLRVGDKIIRIDNKEIIMKKQSNKININELFNLNFETITIERDGNIFHIQNDRGGKLESSL
ncbi:MAG: hypothetical protein N2Z76_08575 [Treponemataceae bacterium]|nr:hypothetical protein [Treponemataceae bacterium]